MKLRYSIPLFILTVISILLSLYQHPVVAVLNLAGAVAWGHEIYSVLKQKLSLVVA